MVVIKLEAALRIAEIFNSRRPSVKPKPRNCSAMGARLALTPLASASAELSRIKMAWQSSNWSSADRDISTAAGSVTKVHPKKKASWRTPLKL